MKLKIQLNKFELWKPDDKDWYYHKELEPWWLAWYSSKWFFLAGDSGKQATGASMKISSYLILQKCRLVDSRKRGTGGCFKPSGEMLRDDTDGYKCYDGRWRSNGVTTTTTSEETTSKDSSLREAEPTNRCHQTSEEKQFQLVMTKLLQPITLSNDFLKKKGD